MRRRAYCSGRETPGNLQHGNRSQLKKTDHHKPHNTTRCEFQHFGRPTPCLAAVFRSFATTRNNYFSKCPFITPCRTLANLSCNTCVLYRFLLQHWYLSSHVCFVQRVTFNMFVPRSSHFPCYELWRQFAQQRSAAVLYQTFQHFASQPPLRLTWSHCLSTAEKEKTEEADFEVTMQSWRCSKGCGRVWEREVKFARLGEPNQHILGRIKAANYHASGQLMHDDFEGWGGQPFL